MCFWCKVEKQHSLVREPIDPWRLRPAEDAASVASRLTIAEIVHEEVDDVRLGLLGKSGELPQRNEGADGEECQSQLGCGSERIG